MAVILFCVIVIHIMQGRVYHKWMLPSLGRALRWWGRTITNGVVKWLLHSKRQMSQLDFLRSIDGCRKMFGDILPVFGLLGGVQNQC